MNDIRLGLDPVLNLSDVSTDVAMARAATCEKFRIAIENNPGFPFGKKNLPVRMVDEVSYIAERGATSKKQLALISRLAAILGESRVCRA